MCAALTTITPIKPMIMTDFFASRTLNSTIKCDEFFANEVPQACLSPPALYAPGDVGLSHIGRNRNACVCKEIRLK